MPKIAYVVKEKGFTNKSLMLVEAANEIIDEYESQGYVLTLRQLYYQMVAKDIIPNNAQSYDNLGNLINQARLMGYVDWDAIEDRTRHPRKRASWKNPQEILDAVARSFHVDHRKTQQYRPEVWVEKDALVDVIGSICDPLDVPYFSCRGYTSQSAMWAASQRLYHHIIGNDGPDENGQEPVIIHMGDHDPSGIDMSRDIEERLNMFLTFHFEEDDWFPRWWDTGITFVRIALNMDQIRQFNPPPNPAKMSDGRSAKYVERYGHSSWELDALSPSQIAAIVRRAINQYTDDDAIAKIVSQEKQEKEKLKEVSRRWEEITSGIDVGSDGDSE